MEYGPRALGNRSILYQATDATVNDWLNKRLKRTEFMPFAPVTLEEFVDKCYEDFDGARYPARFMTITVNCTDWMKKHCPAVVHVDGTARPQIIDQHSNPSYYRILEEYQKLTRPPNVDQYELQHARGTNCMRPFGCTPGLHGRRSGLPCHG